ncbi:MAG TPA: SHOCT domain-containing protein, partial [Solirubrobacterales bacterium]|nr:SHOCT domain-containing protein [Solirubrobacterales bacterium]
PLGLALFVGGIVLFNVKLVSLLETGTCASGNTPYEISQPCPAGTGTDILLLIVSIFGGLIGAAIFAMRGDPPWDRDGRGGRFVGFSLGVFAWGLFFTATGATSLIASLTNQAIQDSSGGKLGGIIVGGTFLVMGLPALLIALGGLVKGFGRRDERPASVTATAGGTSDGVMSRLSAGLDQAQAAQGLASRLPWGTSPPSSGGGGGTGGQIANLERLQKLRESGALTDAVFEREKAKVLAEG